MNSFEKFHAERCEKAAADFDYFREAWMGHFKELQKLVRFNKAEGCLSYTEFEELKDRFEGFIKAAWEYDDKR